MQALAKHKGVNIGTRHKDINDNLNPNSRNSPTMPLPIAVWNAYHMLFQSSRSSRYSGFTSDENAFELIMKIDHSHTVPLLRLIKKYAIQEGIILT